MGEVAWTSEAELWVKEIHDYIAQDNPSAARRTALGIYSKVQLLEQHPKMGYRYEGHRGHEIRILLYGHYRIAYRVKSGGNIDVLGVFHGALDIERYLC
ncbi:MAG: type II toxin-antitoxin system RelE/ParE family toxin [Deltaproteobacteria bacterium]|nr:type II toxin-antitoxin system RelE/ParE family toxin [Deltaproteobacteria bacterium]